MRKSLITIILSLAAVFSLFIGSPMNYVQASEANTIIDIQQEEKFVTIVLDFHVFPPSQL